MGEVIWGTVFSSDHETGSLMTAEVILLPQAKLSTDDRDGKILSLHESSLNNPFIEYPADCERKD